MPVRATDDARPGNRRCPSGPRPMFYESNCHRLEATCICRSTYSINLDSSLPKTKKTTTKIQKYIFRLSSWGWITCNEQVLLKFLQSWTLSELVLIFLILTTCFFWGIKASFDVNVFIIARENTCKIGRAPYGVRLIFYNADRAHGTMFSYI